MRGRKPDSPALKLIKRLPGKRPFDDGPAVEIAAPEAPPHLNGTARALWDELCADLKTARLITKLDKVALAMLCDAWAEYINADAMIARPKEEGGGYLVTTPNGYEVQSPWVAIKNKAFEKLMKAGVEFGLTPSSRNRVGGSGQLPLFGDDDPMEAFLRAGSRVGSPAAS